MGADSRLSSPKNMALSRCPALAPSSIELAPTAHVKVQCSRAPCTSHADQVPKCLANTTTPLSVDRQTRPIAKGDVVLVPSVSARGGPRYTISKSCSIGQNPADPDDLPHVQELIAQLEVWEEWEKNAADMSRPADKRAREISIGFRWVGQGMCLRGSRSKEERCEGARPSRRTRKQKRRKSCEPMRSVSEWTEEEWEEVFQRLGESGRRR